MAINPHADGDPIKATFWYDQFGAELKDRAQEELEIQLHARGICSEQLNADTRAVIDLALETGAVAMGVLLEEKGRTKDGP